MWCAIWCIHSYCWGNNSMFRLFWTPRARTFLLLILQRVYQSITMCNSITFDTFLIDRHIKFMNMSSKRSKVKIFQHSSALVIYCNSLLTGHCTWLKCFRNGTLWIGSIMFSKPDAIAMKFKVMNILINGFVFFFIN